MIARTVPEETKDGEVVICSAWWVPALGGLTRIFPLTFARRCQAWCRYRLELTRSLDDARWRTFELADGGPIECVNTYSAREQLRSQFERLAPGTTIKQLNEKRDSLGVIRPIGALSLHLEECEPDTSREFGRRTFSTRPRLRFNDAGGAHDLSLNEWGCYEWLRKGGEPERLAENLRLDDPTRDQLLLVGNLRNHPTSWVVISVIGYAAIQPALFVG